MTAGRPAAVDRSRLPDVGPILPVAFPAIGKSTLSNGLRVWSVRHSRLPVVSVVLLLRRGAADDPPGRDGLAALTADLLDEGAGGRSALELHREFGRIGAHLDTDIDSDAIILTITTLSRFLARGLALLADVVARPALTDEDVDRVRQLRLHRLRQLRDVAGALADRAFLRLLYGDHPYGHTPVGSEHALASLNADDVRTFHVKTLAPDAATLIAVGDCEHRELEDLAASAFGPWNGTACEPGAAAPAPAQPPRLAGIARPGAPQSELRMGHVAVARSTPDYYALVVANMVLGGQFVSRINLNLREEKGFTYGARTAFDFRRLPGPFSLQASVHTAATIRAIQECVAEITAFRGPRPVSPDELSMGIAALTRGYARNFETADQLARAVTQLALYDLPDDYYSQFVPRLLQVTADDVVQASARHLEPSRLTTVVVGDLDATGAELATLNLGEPVVLSPDSI